ncbi:hypothetical protein H8K33_17975 [Undibacterium amnicola]|uniref:Teneurin-like YD-shell domain-containing protein n=1 Tax=Undibacterium amnicola TaxID=1834038 RepID=A0ABR6XV96_9BURK|nr:hypothetical protein [Undibacterium amnicola]
MSSNANVIVNFKVTASGVAVVRYIHTDGLGSPVAKSDASGNLIPNSRTRYEPYGMTVAGTSIPTIGFTGHVNDADTGLTYMQQRYYDPVAGRFLSTDPVLTDYNTGASFNRYTYALNNPYKYVDPDGRESIVNGKKINIIPEDKSVPRVSIPNTVFASGVSTKDMFFHTYNVTTKSNLTDAGAVGRGIASSPTPLQNNTASPNGTVNMVGGIPSSGNSNFVKSFSVASPDPSKFTDITVNYTVKGAHGLNEGFVMRFGEIGSNGAITLRSYCEGNAWQQMPALKEVWNPQVTKVWNDNQEKIINKIEGK